MRLPAIALAAALLLTLRVSPAPAAVPANFVDQPVVNMLEAPVGFAFLPDGRILVVEQTTGNIKLHTAIFPVTLATLPDFQVSYEEGLLGIAVDPRWPTKPHIYVHYTSNESPSMIHITRFTLAGDLTGTSGGAMTLDLGTRYEILSDIPNLNFNHNGGTVRFGPDQMLYASVGDDNLACNTAQDSTQLSGKILRLDIRGLPDGPGGPADKATIAPADNPAASHPNLNARLVWAMGLRNPFRFHIDALTGDLLIADVGQTEWEEVDLAETGGLNFGWPWREGPVPFSGCATDPTSGFTDPIYSFDHSVGASVISAGVYRQNGGASQFPSDYEGDIFFSDYFSGEIYRLKNIGSGWTIAPPVPGQPSPTAWADGFFGVTDFAIGPDGALWYLRQGTDERIHRIAYVGPTAVDPSFTPAPSPDRAFYDLQGRRVDEPKQNGLYFTREGRRKVVVR